MLIVRYGVSIGEVGLRKITDQWPVASGLFRVGRMTIRMPEVDRFPHCHLECKGKGRGCEWSLADLRAASAHPVPRRVCMKVHMSRHASIFAGLLDWSPVIPPDHRECSCIADGFASSPVANIDPELQCASDTLSDGV